jgi:hypothetical protein
MILAPMAIVAGGGGRGVAAPVELILPGPALLVSCRWHDTER